MTYTRERPSERFTRLLALYREMHEKGVPSQGIAAADTFDGRSLPRHAMNIGSIIDVLGSRTILDYGAGKGHQYEDGEIRVPGGATYPNIRAFWGVDRIHCYDPGHKPFSTLPAGRFDGVVSTDVLEHCPKEDMAWIVAEIFGYAREFVYLNVALYPASKTLPTGENAHITLEPVDWWKALFDAEVARHPGLRYYAAMDRLVPGRDGRKQLEVIALRGKAPLPD
ncbi:MAG: class I SAM-dependent methyltransferase [Alphaproteobacteria bacterium]